jgi:hypothetical protein
VIITLTHERKVISPLHRLGCTQLTIIELTFVDDQHGDQMSLGKIAQNVAQTIFAKINTHFTVEKVSRLY